MLSTFKKVWQASHASSTTATRDLGMAEYCMIRRQQWEAQAAKAYGPVRGAAVVADEQGWRQWEAYGLDRLLLGYAGERAGALRRVLDFGCGVGRVMKKLQSKVGRIDGVDLAPSVLQGAQTYCGADTTTIIAPDEVAKYAESKRSLLFTSNGYELPAVPAKHYSFIYSVVVFFHILHPAVRQNLYREFYRILEPGGRCVLMFFRSTSSDFGDAHRVDLTHGAFAFRSTEEIKAEFAQTAWHILTIDEREPIAVDKEGGVEKTVFVVLEK